MAGSGRRRRALGTRLAVVGLGMVILGTLAACTSTEPSGGTGVSGVTTGSRVAGDPGSHESATASSTATSSTAPMRTSLTVKASASAIREGTPVTLNFTLLGADAPVAGAVVHVAHAGDVTDAVLDATGAGSLVLDTLPGGRQELQVTYAGDSTHAPSSGSVLVTVAALTTVQLSATPSTVAPGVPAVIAIALTSSGAPVAGAVVTLSHGGTSVQAPATDATGKATVRLTSLPAGKNTVTASYPGDALHAPAIGSLGLTVHAESAIAVTASDPHPTSGDPVTVTWTLSAAGKPVANAPVTVSAGGKTSKATTGKDGTGSVTLNELTPGSVPVTVSYAGSAGYGAVTGSVTLAVVGSTDVDIRVADRSVTPEDDITVAFDVTAAHGAVAGAAIVTYGGKSREVTLDKAGHGSVTIAAGTLPIGAHTIRVGYAGSASHAPSSGSITVSVTDNPACPAWAKACVDLTNDVSWLQSNGKIVYGPVPISSGRPGYRTPSGTYEIYWKDKDHRSSLFNNAPMPNSLFFNGGIAFHEGDPGVMSHGCIHLTWSASRKYWDYLGYGDSVVVFGYAPY